MTPKPNVRKNAPPRRYRSDLRRQQAEQTRQRIAAAAADLFAAEGYARTTIAKIAAAAGVSTETVQTQGPKAALMVSAIEYAAFGVSGEDDIFNLDAGRGLLEVEDRDAATDYLVSTQCQLLERSADLANAVMAAAASDSELSRYVDELLAGVTGQHRRMLTVCRNRGWLRDDIPFGELVATFGVLAGIDTFIFLTRREAWTLTRYRSWLRRMLLDSIFART